MKPTIAELIAAYLVEYRRTTGKNDVNVIYRKGYFYADRGGYLARPWRGRKTFENTISVLAARPTFAPVRPAKVVIHTRLARPGEKCPGLENKEVYFAWFDGDAAGTLGPTQAETIAKLIRLNIDRFFEIKHV